MKYLVFSFLLFISCSISKTNLNKLKSDLAEIYNSDQELRQLIDGNTTKDKKSEIKKKYGLENTAEKQLWNKISKNDSLNLIKIEGIIKEYGYPGKSLVGTPLNSTVFLVVQHSELPIIEKYFPIIKEAGKKGELSMTSVAMMEDRMLMYQGKKQIYGTQVSGKKIIDSETQKESWEYFVWPIEDSENVNKRRKQIGFEESIEEYANNFGIKYTKRELEK
ncbi:Uncharacterised protein [Chryseobacterium taklimakanense]|uniref:Uncharacterized protein n=1 Tax=Chryseobacterium taklimakanense TaxID=536441 RepID=A0A239WDI1_9FLAO|nr:DUF6624 domain-containing protein [Chryseobacterium taklimakanense]SNV32136.1 Uncharacterised protein [Chryseobacterium taklimakanense]